MHCTMRSRPDHRQTHYQSNSRLQSRRRVAQGLHVGLPFMHVLKQRGRPPSSEGGNVPGRYQPGMVIRCIRSVFLHHIVKSSRRRSCIRHQHLDCVREITQQDSNYRFPGIKSLKTEHIWHNRSTTHSVFKSTTLSRCVSFEDRIQ